MEHDACSTMLKLASLSACWRVRKSRVPKGKAAPGVENTQRSSQAPRLLRCRLLVAKAPR